MFLDRAYARRWAFRLKIGTLIPSRSLRFVASGCKGPVPVTSKRVLARKWRPPFFLFSAAKKVGRHKSGQANGLCSEARAPSTKKWRFWVPKKRHFAPFFLAHPGGRVRLCCRSGFPARRFERQARFRSSWQAFRGHTDWKDRNNQTPFTSGRQRSHAQGAGILGIFVDLFEEIAGTHGAITLRSFSGTGPPGDCLCSRPARGRRRS